MTVDQLEAAYYWWLSHLWDTPDLMPIVRWHLAWLDCERKQVAR